MKVNCLNPIAQEGLRLFSENYQLTDQFSEANIALVRSASVHDLELPVSMLAIARAGAGVNNIPLDRCAENGVVVFNTPGANANGVKELVLAGMFLAARDIIGGCNWVQSIKAEPEVGKLVEKGKKKFAGGEVMGKTLGILGLGAIGILVANYAKALGMNVVAYTRTFDETKKAKLAKGVTYVNSMDDVLSQSDYLSLHMALKDETRGMINRETIAKMKDGVVILDFARDTLVNDDDLEVALKSGKVYRYVTDFPNDKVVNMESVIAIPHLGASTKESEDNCAIMAVNQVRDYIENGNITNSVNYPACNLGMKSTNRVAILYQVGVFNAEEAMGSRKGVNAVKGEYGYCLIECADGDQVLEKYKEAEGVIRVRLI